MVSRAKFLATVALGTRVPINTDLIRIARTVWGKNVCTGSRPLLIISATRISPGIAHEI
jgi:hypothetical protein